MKRVEGIKKDINSAQEKISSILKEEDFSAYYQVQENLNKSINLIKSNNFKEAEKYLLFSIRLLMEAPPKNESLGLETLHIIDKAYKELSIQFARFGKSLAKSAIEL